MNHMKLDRVVMAWHRSPHKQNFLWPEGSQEKWRSLCCEPCSANLRGHFLIALYRVKVIQRWFGPLLRLEKGEKFRKVPLPDLFRKRPQLIDTSNFV
jgi:hypothetical protein